MNGADCSAGANPLNQVLKREGVDNSLFRVSTGWAVRHSPPPHDFGRLPSFPHGGDEATGWSLDPPSLASPPYRWRCDFF
jgi:hypothetical protein